MHIVVFLLCVCQCVEPLHRRPGSNRWSLRYLLMSSICWPRVRRILPRSTRGDMMSTPFRRNMNYSSDHAMTLVGKNKEERQTHSLLVVHRASVAKERDVRE